MSGQIVWEDYIILYVYKLYFPYTYIITFLFGPGKPEQFEIYPTILFIDLRQDWYVHIVPFNERFSYIISFSSIHFTIVSKFNVRICCMLYADAMLALLFVFILIFMTTTQ